ncbi:putative ankyrin repeat protein RF_0381 isoform X2 [Halyomorpha halys]|nr:uncharacterized protein LOC106691285 isoform X2 [Halyomorpha halys]XP_014292493.1 uncharacterized protein LOC106691285 isoform X2 [Halyomorpha halys]XP_014292494.1 uncharacterized protein LOC106691285 isoform X2 [Halyomorpha halys]XP_014292495.1 uncharacterized protein LOC106691285 isoform X2 [Halyomorpha halys]XP_014292496.1 uncharacterized protein LOC106691285 isoform X2 [Halyomorpha halys]
MVSKYLLRSSVNSLAEAKALVNLKDNLGRYPIHVAIEKNDVATLKSILRLVDHVNHPDGSGKTPLFYAVAIGNQEMVDLLIENGADTKTRDNDGNTLLHVAAENCKIEILANLLELPTSTPVDVKDKYHWTPLHKSSWFGCKQEATLLLMKGAKVDALTDTNLTPLIMAIGRKHLAVAELLLQHKADPNIKPNNGWTALHRAAASGFGDGVKLLLFHGADMYLADNLGRTPMHIAIERNSVDAIQVLTMNGYELSTKDFTPTNENILFF